MRTSRYFYDLKLDGELHYKQKRNKMGQRFLIFTDFLVGKYFDKEMMRLFNVDKLENISNCLAALIQPKCLLAEFKNIQKDINLLRKEMSKLPT